MTQKVLCPQRTPSNNRICMGTAARRVIIILLFKSQAGWEQEFLSRALPLTGERSNKRLCKKRLSLTQSVYQGIAAVLCFLFGLNFIIITFILHE